jgi:hypothetical protein
MRAVHFRFRNHLVDSFIVGAGLALPDAKAQ